MTLVKQVLGVLLFAVGAIFVLDGLFTFGLEAILGGVVAVAAGVYVLQRA